MWPGYVGFAFCAPRGFERFQQRVARFAHFIQAGESVTVQDLHVLIAYQAVIVLR